MEPKPILRLDITKPRRSSGGSVEFQKTPEFLGELSPPSPQPSADRLSVSWGPPLWSPSTPSSPLTDTPPAPEEVPSMEPRIIEPTFVNTDADGSEDEDYSASVTAILQRRASCRSRRSRRRRASSPFTGLGSPGEDSIIADAKRRSSVFTTSSGDTAISIEDGGGQDVTQEQIFENIRLHKEVLSSVKMQPWHMRRKLRLVQQAKSYVARHEGALQERLAASRSTRDMVARCKIIIAAWWQRWRREAANFNNWLIPWELRIKEIESHFGSVVASYFTFLRWLFWVNIVITLVLTVFVVVPEMLTADPRAAGERKVMLPEEVAASRNLVTLWDFEGALKYSPIFYGFYTNREPGEHGGYRLPLAYFVTGLAVYAYSFVATLRKMAENSRLSKLSSKDDECVFSWKLFTGWDYMIGNAETAHNRVASIVLGFKEALLEEAEKNREARNWKIIALRVLVNLCVLFLLVVSAVAVVQVVARSAEVKLGDSWWRQNEITVVMSLISLIFPIFFEVLGFLEHYHPRKQLRIQLARIMVLNLLNLYSLIFALFDKISDMTDELKRLKPNATSVPVTKPMTTTTQSLPSSTMLPSTPRTTSTSTHRPSSPFVTTSAPSTEKTTFTDASTTEADIFTTDAYVNITSYVNEYCYEVPIPCNGTYNGNANVTLLSILVLNLTATTILPILSSRSYNNFTLEGSFNVTDYLDYDNTTDLIILDETSTYNSAGDSDNTIFGNITTYQPESTEINKITNGYGKVNPDSFEYYDYLDNLTLNDDSNAYSASSNRSSTKVFTYSDYIRTTFLPSFKNVTNHLFANDKLYFDDLDYYQDYLDNVTIDNEQFNYTELIETTIMPILNNFTNVFDQNGTYNDLNITYFFDELTTIMASFVNDSKENETCYVIKCEPTNTTDMSETINKANAREVSQAKVIKQEYETRFNYYTAENFGIANEIKERTNSSSDPDLELTSWTSNLPISSYTTEASRTKSELQKAGLDLNVRRKLRGLCWETMFGQELVKLTVMDLLLTVFSTLLVDFFRALFVRYMNSCWCWDLEKQFPQYGDFKIAENILHLVNNQGMVWMGMFFSPGLVALNLIKLVFMMYLRSWAVMTCNVPHEVVFRASRSNNFYLALLLTMLFLCVLPVGYAIVWVEPSWHCGPFSNYERIYYLFTETLHQTLPSSLHLPLDYIASPGTVIPLLVLLVLVIYYLVSLTGALREANHDLKLQLRRERTEERRKMYRLSRGHHGSSQETGAGAGALSTRWRRALALKVAEDGTNGEGADSKIDDRKEFLTRIMKRAFLKSTGTTSEDDCAFPRLVADDETDNEQHESLPDENQTKEVKKSKILHPKEENPQKKQKPSFKKSVGIAVHETKKSNDKTHQTKTKEKHTEENNFSDTKSKSKDKMEFSSASSQKETDKSVPRIRKDSLELNKKRTHEGAAEHSRSTREDSLTSIWSNNVPAITISKTESEECILEQKNEADAKKIRKSRRKNGDMIKQKAEPQKPVINPWDLKHKKDNTGARDKGEENIDKNNMESPEESKAEARPTRALMSEARKWRQQTSFDVPTEMDSNECSIEDNTVIQSSSNESIRQQVSENNQTESSTEYRE